MTARPSMPELAPHERTKSFREVERGLALHQALAEAARCLFCHDAPCVAGCPAGVDVVGFIRRLKTRNFVGAARLVRESNVFAGACARVCPAEELCERECSSKKLAEPIAIAALQRFVADEEQKRGIRLPGAGLPTGKRVAVVGSGPAGLACACELVRLGHTVTVFEEEEIPGGLLAFGIPRYRLPQEVVDAELAAIVRAGVEIVTGASIGGSIGFDELKGRYDATFIGVGLGYQPGLGVPGEDLPGILRAGEFLRRVARGSEARLSGVIAIIGGGNVAMDAACSALRCGAGEVVVLYRRSRDEMPAWKREYEFAVEEGVRFEFLTAPLGFVPRDGRVAAVRCASTRLGEPGQDGRPRPKIVPGSEHMIEVQGVIVATGQAPRANLPALFGGLGTGPRGEIAVSPETQVTSLGGVFAGGDAANGGLTVVQAVAEGRKGARSIDAYLARRDRGVATEASRLG